MRKQGYESKHCTHIRIKSAADCDEAISGFAFLGCSIRMDGIDFPAEGVRVQLGGLERTRRAAETAAIAGGGGACCRTNSCRCASLRATP